MSFAWLVAAVFIFLAVAVLLMAHGYSNRCDKEHAHLFLLQPTGPYNCSISDLCSFFMELLTRNFWSIDVSTPTLIVAHTRREFLTTDYVPYSGRREIRHGYGLDAARHHTVERESGYYLTNRMTFWQTRVRICLSSRGFGKSSAEVTWEFSTDGQCYELPTRGDQWQICNDLIAEVLSRFGEVNDAIDLEGTQSKQAQAKSLVPLAWIVSLGLGYFAFQNLIVTSSKVNSIAESEPSKSSQDLPSLTPSTVSLSSGGQGAGTDANSGPTQMTGQQSLVHANNTAFSTTNTIRDESETKTKGMISPIYGNYAVPPPAMTEGAKELDSHDVSPVKPSIAGSSFPNNESIDSAIDELYSANHSGDITAWNRALVSLTSYRESNTSDLSAETFEEALVHSDFSKAKDALNSRLAKAPTDCNNWCFLSELLAIQGDEQKSTEAMLMVKRLSSIKVIRDFERTIRDSDYRKAFHKAYKKAKASSDDLPDLR